MSQHGSEYGELLSRPATARPSWDAPLLAVSLLCLIGLGSMLSSLYYVTQDYLEKSIIEVAARYTEAVTEFRTIYTSEVVERLATQGIEATHLYKEREGTIPLPATLSMELGRRLGKLGTGAKMRLYSEYPFPWRKEGGPRDAFEKDALRQLKRKPNQPFFRFEMIEGQKKLRYATADLMRPVCVRCHNSHPDTPKNDWSSGDLRGVLEVALPVTTAFGGRTSGIHTAFVIAGFVVLFGIILLSMVVARQRRNAALVVQNTIKLEHEVAMRTWVEQELRRAKEAAELANRSKSDFLAVMSHELRTPLNAILGFSAMIKEQLLGPVNVHAYVDYGEDIFNSGRHLLRLINDLLDLSKIEAGKLELNMDVFEVSEALTKVIHTLKPMAAREKVIVKSEFNGNLPTLRADRRAFDQIMLNLLSNALKFTPEGGHVTVHSAGIGKETRFAIADTGIGIHPDDIEKMLEPWGQVKDPSTIRGAGFGLGLPIVKALVEMHGGRIDIKSKVNIGTTVTVTLPNEAP